MSDRYPSPPSTIRDGEGRPIQIEVVADVDRWTEPLVRMYDRFDPEDRAQGIPPTGEGAIRDWLERILPSSTNVIARDGDRVVGHATLVPDPPEERAAPSRWELAIFVEGAYQQSGIGRSLLEHLLGAARDAGIDRIWLTVERWNEPAIRLYRSVGFENLESERFEREMELVFDA